MLNESKFLELYGRQQESGLKVKDFCSNEGIAEATFYYWKKKLHKDTSKNRFIPLVVKSGQPSIRQNFKTQSPSENYGQQKTENEFLLELVYPNGTRLRIKNDLDLTHLRALIDLLD